MEKISKRKDVNVSELNARVERLQSNNEKIKDILGCISYLLDHSKGNTDKWRNGLERIEKATSSLIKAHDRAFA